MSVCGDYVQVYNVSELCKLHLSILEAKDLPSADSNGLSDPYVTVRAERGLFIKDGALKTGVKMETLNPKWNQSFDVLWNQRFRKLVLRVYDHDKWSKDDYLGKARIYYHDFSDQVEHDVWLPLYKSNRDRTKVGEIHVKYKGTSPFPLVFPLNTIHLEFIKKDKDQDIMVGVGWDLRLSSSLDSTSGKASILGLDYRFKRVDRFSSDFPGFDGCMKYIADNLTESDDFEDNENYSIQLQKLHVDIKYLVVCIHICNGIKSFSCVKGAFIRVTKELKKNTSRTLAFHRATARFTQPGCIMAVIKRSYNGQWTFTSAVQPIPGLDIDESTDEIIGWVRQNITP